MSFANFFHDFAAIFRLDRSVKIVNRSAGSNLNGVRGEATTDGGGHGLARMATDKTTLAIRLFSSGTLNGVFSTDGYS
jgi:hypothetical protein